MTEVNNQTFSGRCNCGALTFSCSGSPINAVFCYCKACQRHTTSDKFFGLWFPKDQFHITKGKPITFNRLGDSGKNVVMHFCETCGCDIAGFIEVGNFYSVAAAALDNNEALRPKMLIYTDHAKPWAVYPENVPKYKILPPELGGNG